MEHQAAHARLTIRSYNLGTSSRDTRRAIGRWGCSVQSARPRDLGALVLVVGLFVTLFILTLVIPGVR